MATTIRFNGGGERVVRDDSFVMNEIGVRYTEDSELGNEMLHVIPWSVIHEVIREREAIVVTQETAVTPEAAAT